jgi:hypothetical protein
MPLTKSHENSVGRKLFVLPYYGYGWARLDSAAPPESLLDALGPEPFDIQVDDYIHCESELMGVSGCVIKPKAVFDGYWCCCALRNIDSRNFTDQWGDYIVWISQRKLPVIPEKYPKKALGDWVVVDKSVFCWVGYGTVAESMDWIKDIYNRTMHSREEVRKLVSSATD